jgi:isochorismate pyruvate lyase
MPLVHCKNLEEVRAQIDRVDERIVELLTVRLQYLKLAAQFKKPGHDVQAPERVHQVLTRVRALAKMNGMEPDAIEKIYKAIIEALIKEEMKAAPRTAS